MRLDVAVPKDLQGHLAGIAGSLEFGRQRLKSTLDGLTPDQLKIVPPGLSNSIATLVVHICAVEANFGHRLVGEKTPDEVKVQYLLNQPQSPLPSPEGETVESLTEKMDRSRALLIGCLSRLTAADLEREIEFSGGRRPTVRWILALLPSHQSMHLGHIQMVKKLIG